MVQALRCANAPTNRLEASNHHLVAIKLIAIKVSFRTRKRPKIVCTRVWNYILSERHNQLRLHDMCRKDGEVVLFVRQTLLEIFVITCAHRGCRMNRLRGNPYDASARSKEP